jgi:hypothetical protein
VVAIFAIWAELETTTFIADSFVLISKWVLLDPLDPRFFSVVQGDIKITNRLRQKNG